MRGAKGNKLMKLGQAAKAVNDAKTATHSTSKVKKLGQMAAAKSKTRKG